MTMLQLGHFSLAKKTVYTSEGINFAVVQFSRHVLHGKKQKVLFTKI